MYDISNDTRHELRSENNHVDDVGELLGVASVAIAAVVGVSAVMLKYPELFFALKWLGAGYLFWLGINMWQAKGKLAITPTAQAEQVNKWALFSQGLITAIANPKGWAFMVSLLPPFIDPNQAMLPQLSLLVMIILSTEFTCMLLYASGGKTIARSLSKGNNLALLNKISAGLMFTVALWLALG